MNSLPVHAAAALICAGAGLCVFLFVLNRYLIDMRSLKLKAPLTLAALLLLVGGAAMAGWSRAGGTPVAASVGVLGLVAGGEVRRLVIRRRCAGAPAVETSPHHVSVARPVTTTDLVCRRYEIEAPAWRGGALRVAHVSDLHVNTRLPREFYTAVFKIVERTRPDFVLFSGDFILTRESLPALRRLLRPLGARGTYGVLGNHDYWEDPAAVGEAVKSAGITLLMNESADIAIDGAPLRITGCDYPWNAAGERAIGVAPEDVLHLVISHTPDNVYRASRAGASCVFAGHCHAGQVRLPFLGPIVVPSVYGRRFDHGHFVVKGTHLFVAGGVGPGDPPFRLYCHPDIFIIDIAAAGGFLLGDRRHSTASMPVNGASPRISRLSLIWRV